MSDEQDCPKCPPPGAPGWMGTFADLMSLLMCFFVLLLSFAEMDAMKFKRLAGSMAQAFGVQTKLDVKDPPKGTSVIAQEFSPGRPEPTPINEIFQHTDDLTELSLEVECAEEYEVEAGSDSKQAGVQMPVAVAEKIKQLIQETENDAVDLAKALSKQIAEGEVEVETTGRKIVLRIREHGSFISGSARLADDYIPLLQEVRNVLATKKGTITVEGHTDNIPIQSSRFRSNWELSTSRAVSVAHELFSGGILKPQRFRISGFGDVHPVDSNETADGRAKNRRVEIVVQQGMDQDLKEEIQVLKHQDKELYDSLQLDDEVLFDLRPDEIF
ncbi:flagellar motor protein MotB [Dasania marina]|uniref:flagellar motor protein MotB n=1 Tax=Dasania marina TaxID=471499 RepID=UPI00036BFAB2|nr:flagellar motor protein MotB [Dasania marina]